MSDTFVTPWTVACQAPLSMGFPRQEHWSGLPFPSQGDLPDPGIKPKSPALQEDSLLCKPPGKPYSELNECPVQMSSPNYPEDSWTYLLTVFTYRCAYIWCIPIDLQKLSNCLSWRQLEFVEYLLHAGIWHLDKERNKLDVVQGAYPGGVHTPGMSSWVQFNFL